MRSRTLFQNNRFKLVYDIRNTFLFGMAFDVESNLYTLLGFTLFTFKPIKVVRR
jgi:hypothetical protein